MPSLRHEDLLRLFQNHPELAADLAREALHAKLPAYSDVRIDSTNLSDLRPAEYRADLVVLLIEHGPVHGIIVEVQLEADSDKPFVWPAYVCNLRNRVRCPVCLLVMTVSERVARWARRTIELGGESRFKPWVLSPAAIPEITDERQAKEDPELSVLSAIAHAADVDSSKAARIATAAHEALLGLDNERSLFYDDMLFHALSEAARRALRAMNLPKYEFKTEFAKRYYGQGLTEGKAEGKAEGRTEGRAELVLRQLSLRFGTLPEAVQERIRGAGIEELDRIGERLLTAGTLDEALEAR